MTLTDRAAIAQIAAAVLIIPPLVDPALLIRQTTQQARASAGHQYLETNEDLNLAVISSKQVASVHRRGVGDFGALDEDTKKDPILLPFRPKLSILLDHACALADRLSARQRLASDTAGAYPSAKGFFAVRSDRRTGTPGSSKASRRPFTR